MSFLVFGGIIFWIFIGIIFLILLFTVEENNENEILEGRLTTPLIVSIIAVSICIWSNNPLNIFNNFKENIVNLILIIFFYLILGVIWSFFRWMMVVKSAYKKYLKTKEDRIIINIKLYIPEVKDWKESIASWIIFWPISVLRYICGNMLVDFMNWIINKLTGLYDKITDKIFKDGIE